MHLRLLVGRVQCRERLVLLRLLRLLFCLRLRWLFAPFVVCYVLINGRRSIYVLVFGPVITRMVMVPFLRVRLMLPVRRGRVLVLCVIRLFRFGFVVLRRLVWRRRWRILRVRKFRIKFELVFWKTLFRSYLLVPE